MGVFKQQWPLEGCRKILQSVAASLLTLSFVQIFNNLWLEYL